MHIPQDSKRCRERKRERENENERGESDKERETEAKQMIDLVTERKNRNKIS